MHIRPDFKVLLTAYQIVNGLAPSYLSDLLKPYIPPHAPCSQRVQGSSLSPEFKQSQQAAEIFFPSFSGTTSSAEAFKIQTQNSSFYVANNLYFFKICASYCATL